MNEPKIVIGIVIVLAIFVIGIIVWYCRKELDKSYNEKMLLDIKYSPEFINALQDKLEPYISDEFIETAKNLCTFKDFTSYVKAYLKDKLTPDLMKDIPIKNGEHRTLTDDTKNKMIDALFHYNGPEGETTKLFNTAMSKYFENLIANSKNVEIINGEALSQLEEFNDDEEDFGDPREDTSLLQPKDKPDYKNLNDDIDPDISIDDIEQFGTVEFFDEYDQY